MPNNPSYPGVYIEEIPSGIRTISGVSTSIAVFIGLASFEKSNDAKTLFQPKPRILFSFSEYEQEFGPLHPLSDLAMSVRLFFQNGGSQCYVVNILDQATTARTKIKKTKQKSWILKLK